MLLFNWHKREKCLPIFSGKASNIDIEPKEIKTGKNKGGETTRNKNTKNQFTGPIWEEETELQPSNNISFKTINQIIPKFLKKII